MKWSSGAQICLSRCFDYTASDGIDENHRLYVLESQGRDPLGPYSFKTRVYDPAHDGWAIDPSVFRTARR